MTKKRKSNKRVPNQLDVVRNPDEDKAVTLARTVLQPTIQAAASVREYGKVFGDLDLEGLIEALSEQTKATEEGDLSRAEAMLTAQAHTLDAIFNHMSRRAINADYVNQLDLYLKLGLRAQSQCRATWEAVATIKNPPVMGYVRQANIANGPQQVNNGSAPDETSRARENPNLQNKLLEENDGERLDTRTTGTTGGIDSAMETVGEVDRPEE